MPRLSAALALVWPRAIACRTASSRSVTATLSTGAFISFFALAPITVLDERLQRGCDILRDRGIAGIARSMWREGRVQAARYTLGETDLMTVIAAVIVGGTALYGGRGTILGALAGSLLP